jgi:large subunit ribosomal protein L21
MALNAVRVDAHKGGREGLRSVENGIVRNLAFFLRLPSRCSCLPVGLGYRWRTAGRYFLRVVQWASIFLCIVLKQRITFSKLSRLSFSTQDSPMYAIISEGGRQFKVEEGQELDIDYRDLPAGEQVKFDRVLAYRDDELLRVGQPILEGASVTGEVLAMVQGPKLVIQKSRRRKTYRRKTGHRQLYTRVRISKIELG